MKQALLMFGSIVAILLGATPLYANALNGNFYEIGYLVGDASGILVLAAGITDICVVRRLNSRPLALLRKVHTRTSRSQNRAPDTGLAADAPTPTIVSYAKSYVDNANQEYRRDAVAAHNKRIAQERVRLREDVARLERERRIADEIRRLEL